MDSWQNLFTASEGNKEQKTETPDAQAQMVQNMNLWVDAQKKMVDSWQTMFKMPTEGQANPFAPWTAAMQNTPYSNFYQGMNDIYKTQSDMMNTMAKAYENSPMGQYFGNLQDPNAYLEKFQSFFNPMRLSQIMDGDSATVFKKVMDSSALYQTMFKFWEEIGSKYVNPATEEFEKFYTESLDTFKEMYKSLVLPLIPEQFTYMYEAPLQSMDNFSDSFNRYGAPWKESFNDLKDLFIQGVSGDPEKLGEYFKLWKERYTQTFGAYMNAPMMTNNGELMELQNKAVDRLISMSTVAGEFFAKVQSVTQENLKTSMKKYMEMVEDGSSPTTYKDFYNFWSREVENILNTYFYTDEFSKMLGEFAGAYADVKIQNDKLMEKYLENLPIALKSDMVSLYKKVQEMSRSVKALEKKVKTLEAAQPEPKAPASKTTSSK